jgi:hypothetical protein
MPGEFNEEFNFEFDTPDGAAQRSGLSYTVNIEGRDYPLIRPSSDIKGLLSDMYLNHPDPAAEPLRVEWVYGFAKYIAEEESLVEEPEDLPITPTHDCDIKIVDANGVTVFDTTEATYYSAADFGDRLRVHEWSLGEMVLRVVQWTAVMNVDDATEYELYIEPESAVIDARCADKRPKRVTSVRTGLVTATNDIVLEAGFNTVLDVAQRTEGLRNITRITVTSAPGGGLGRFEACQEPDILVRRINGVSPNAYGEFKLETDLCHYVRQPTEIVDGKVRPTAATLKIGNDCSPCCKKEDFIATYENFRQVYNRWVGVGSNYMSTRDSLVDQIQRFTTVADCRRLDVLDLVARASGGFNVEVLASFCNMQSGCNRNVEIRFGFTINNPAEGCDEEVSFPSCSVVLSSDTGGSTLGNVAPILDDDGNPTGGYSVFWDYLSPGRPATVRFRAIVPCTQESTSLTITATAYVNGVPQPSAEAPQVRTITVAVGSGC